VSGINPAALHAPIHDDGGLVLEPLAERHREGLRACCLADDAVWEIYPITMAGENFDPAFDAMQGNPGRLAFAVIEQGVVVGTTGFLHLALERQGLEIGGTLMAPAVRGSGLNARVKALLLGRAFGCGVRRVEFRIDVRNGRSERAVAKLGAVREGVLRAERITWTGHCRDTAVWSILSSEYAP